ncbi:MAG: protein kinase [Deltaproteobacteria bacterium]|nr:protein kinase [Deltaproteobacteria bacterium]
MSPRSVILCVDDERTVLTSIREQLLRSFGDEHTIETASSGDEALETYDELAVDGAELAVVISDHIMPGIKGDELLRRLHARAPDARKIMLTGQASADAVGSVVNGADLYRYLSKPWEADDLRLTVRGAIESWRSVRAEREQRATLRELVDVSLSLTANLAGADRYAQLLRSAHRILHADRVAILRRDGEVLRPLATTHSGVGAVALSEHLELAADLTAARPVRRAGEAEAGVVAGAFGWTVGALVTAPLSMGDEIAGLLVLGWDPAAKHEQPSDERITAFATLAAAAVRTTELVDALEAAAERRRRVASELSREAAVQRGPALLGDSVAIRKLRAEIRVCGLGPAVPILVVGPAGSGIDAVADAIHAAWAPADRPLLTVDCAMVRDADALFGATGTLSIAAGGTVHLAGIVGLSRDLQTRLADVLASRAPLPHIVASALRDPDATSLEPALRRELRDECVRMPALRERPDDIEPLAAHFLAEHARRLGRPARTLSQTSLERLRAYPWPGNVDELSHVIERAVLASNRDVVEVDESMLDTGAAVGSYRLVERIARGGMGEVWRARHPHLARPAAVKLIQAEAVAQTNDAVARFRREASATAALRSPHSVELYDFGTTASGEYFYVMELLEGWDLQVVVERWGPLPPSRAVHLVAQACLAIGEAHHAGLVHRDIKPANLFVSQLGLEPDFVKVLDFGMVSAREDDVTLTRAGQIQGTPAYMAPEHATGGGSEVDARSDVYALGCVLFWLLTGRKVFEEPNVARTILAHVGAQPDPPSVHAPTALPAELDALVLRCLEKNPEARPQTAMELRDALAALPLPQWSIAEARAWWSAPKVTGDVISPPSPIGDSTTGATVDFDAAPTGGG